jgi:DNA polymerase-1
MARVAVVDGNPLVWRASQIYAHLTLRSGRPSGCVYGATENLLRAWKAINAEHLVVVWDWGRSRWRREAFIGYKASRELEKKKPIEPKRVAARTVLDTASGPPTLPAMPEKPTVTRADVMDQLRIVQRLLDLGGVMQVAVQDVEADDLIGITASGLARENHEVVIVAGDHDLHQLVAPGITIYDPVKKAWLSEKDIGAYYDGLDRAQIADFLALSGEAGDDIPKIPGVGRKRAVELLSKYGSIAEIVAAEPDPKWSKLVWGRALLEGKDTLLLAQKLTKIPTIQHVSRFLNVDERERLAGAYRRSVVSERLSLAGLCEQWELNRFLTQLDGIFAMQPPHLLPLAEGVLPP